MSDGGASRRGVEEKVAVAEREGVGGRGLMAEGERSAPSNRCLRIRVRFGR